MSLHFYTLISIPPVGPSPSLLCPALALICYTGFCPLLYISKFVSLLMLYCAEAWKQAPSPIRCVLYVLSPPITVYVHPVFGNSALCSFLGPRDKGAESLWGFEPLPRQQAALISHHGPTVASGVSVRVWATPKTAGCTRLPLWSYCGIWLLRIVLLPRITGVTSATKWPGDRYHADWFSSRTCPSELWLSDLFMMGS